MPNRIEPPILMSRLLTFVFAGAGVTLIVLLFTLYKMFPLNRPQVFFLLGQRHNDVEVYLRELPPADENLDRYKRAFIREYIKARNEIVPNAKTMEEKWRASEDGIVRTWSTDKVFGDFVQTAMWNAMMNNVPDFEFSCSVEFHPGTITPYTQAKDTYIVNFSYFCADNDRQIPRKDYKIKLRLDLKDGSTLKWADRINNPLGIRVAEYSIESGNGDPLDTGFLGNE